MTFPADLRSDSMISVMISYIYTLYITSAMLHASLRHVPATTSSILSKCNSVGVHWVYGVARVCNCPAFFRKLLKGLRVCVSVL